MKNNLDFVFLLSFFVSILLGTLSFVISRKLKSKELSHLAEFWCSLAVMMVVSFALRDQPERVMSLSLLGWIWPVKTILQISKDMSGLEFTNRPKVVVLAIGGFLTLALVSYGLPFSVYTAPFCLALGVVGVLLFRDLYGPSQRGKYSVLGNVSFGLLGLFFLLRVFYPIWRTNFAFYGSAAHLLILIGLGASTLAYYMEVMKERHELQLVAVLKERSDQLFGQSKYSELGMMSAGIAHEINNPLAIIQAKTTQLLRIHKNAARESEVTEGLEQILYTSERINRTIQGVRDFVHQDERVPDEEFTVKNLVDDVLAFCGQRMKNHGVSLRFYGLEGLKLHGYKIQLEQVLLNLLNNSFDAIEFLPDKWIEMSAEYSEHTVKLFFKDSGSGISPAVAARIMEPFFTTKTIGKGTGLGLALARGIVEKHGGTLSYVPGGKHTTFLRELPKMEDLRTIMHRKPSVSPQVDLSGAIH